MTRPPREQPGKDPVNGTRYRLRTADGRYASYALGAHTVCLADEATAYVFGSLADADSAAMAFGKQLDAVLFAVAYPHVPGGIRVGDRVKFRDPRTSDESVERFEVLELRGERALVRSIGTQMRITPTFAYRIDELAMAG